MTESSGQPKGLGVLFFTEMWERFSFYGMRALLTLYLTLELFKDLQDPLKRTTAYGIYAAYGALVYATPFIGGLLADRFLGHKRSVMWGAILMAIGHFVMAIQNEWFLYVALAFLILGNGFFKPNISSIVGNLYGENDKRRDGGFTIFYMGINLGAFLAPAACGYLGETYGWHYGFGLAGIGMLAGLFIFNHGNKPLQGNGETPPAGTQSIGGVSWLTPVNIIYALSFVVVGFLAVLVKHYELMTYVLTPFALGVIGILFIHALRSNKIDRERMFVILILLFFTTLFWAFFEQAGSSLTLFANENVNRHIFGSVLPASLFQSTNPLFILIFGLLFSLMWTQLGKKGKEPSTPLKFAMGVFLLGIGFLLLAVAPYFTKVILVDIGSGGHRILVMAATVPMVFLVLSYLFQTLGELCLSPIGLSMVTKLASPKAVAMVMGAWFLSSAMAHHLGGVIANFTSESENKSAIELTISEIQALWDDPQTISETDTKILRTALGKAMAVVSENANTVIRPIDPVEEFEILRAADSAWFYLKDTLPATAPSERIQASLADIVGKGAQQLVINAHLAKELAMQTGYFNRKDLDRYSVMSLNSLSNLLTYTNVFKVLGIIACLAAALLLLLVPLLRKMMHGIN